MNASVPRVFLDEDEKTPDNIRVTTLYRIYRCVCAALMAMDATTKPEDYIMAMLEGHLRRLNL